MELIRMDGGRQQGLYVVREGVKGRLVGMGQGGVAGGREGEVGLVIAGRMVGTRRIGCGRGG